MSSSFCRFIGESVWISLTVLIPKSSFSFFFSLLFFLPDYAPDNKLEDSSESFSLSELSISDSAFCSSSVSVKSEFSYYFYFFFSSLNFLRSSLSFFFLSASARASAFLFSYIFFCTVTWSPIDKQLLSPRSAKNIWIINKPFYLYKAVISTCFFSNKSSSCTSLGRISPSVATVLASIVVICISFIWKRFSSSSSSSSSFYSYSLDSLVPDDT